MAGSSVNAAFAQMTPRSLVTYGRAELAICKGFQGWLRGRAVTVRGRLRGAIHGRKSHLVGAADRARRLKMSTRVTLVPGTVATAPDARRDIARGFKLARRWQQQGKWREAEQAYDGILTVELKQGLGAVYKQQGRRKEAVALFRRPAAGAPDSPDIRTDFGVILANLDQPEEAVTCFEKALSAHPDRGPLLEAIEIAVTKAGARSRPMASNHA